MERWCNDNCMNFINGGEVASVYDGDDFILEDITDTLTHVVGKNAGLLSKRPYLVYSQTRTFPTQWNQHRSI